MSDFLQNNVGDILRCFALCTIQGAIFVHAAQKSRSFAPHIQFLEFLQWLTTANGSLYDNVSQWDGKLSLPAMATAGMQKSQI